jgi:short-subunit dehydrogenase
MRDRGRGHLVGISSLSGYVPAPGAAAYCASKAGLSCFLEGLRLELAGTGVQVTAVHPGWVRTPSMANPPFPTPGLLECADAADYIVSRLPAAPARLDFPWYLALPVHATRFLPRPLLHALLRWTRWGR